MNVRPLRVLRDVNRNLAEQLDAEHAAEEAARFEIARSASQFSRRSREVVDGTLNLSAVLMRAGEVEEANRLLAEAEREVRSEEAVLIETVAEVRAEGLERRSRITRLKLMRMLATAFLGGSLMVFSAFGVAVAKFLTDAPPAANAQERTGAKSVKVSGRTAPRGSKRVLVPGTGMRVSLSGKALSDYMKMKNDPSVAPDDLRAFLLALAPDELASKLVTSVAQVVDETVVKTARAASGAIASIKDEARQEEAAPSESPSAGPSEGPADAEEESSPSPSPSDEETEEPAEGEGSEDGSDQDGNSHLPSPLPPLADPDEEG